MIENLMRDTLKTQITAVIFIVAILTAELLLGSLITIGGLVLFPQQNDLVKVFSKLALLAVLFFALYSRPQKIVWTVQAKMSTYIILVGFVIISIIKWLILDQFIVSTNQENIYSLISAIIIAPIFEELLFRGWMIPFLRSKRFGIIATLCVTSVLFYLWHGQLFAFHRILIGLLLGYTFVREKNITIPILAHSLANLTVITIQYFNN